MKEIRFEAETLQTTLETRAARTITIRKHKPFIHDMRYGEVFVGRFGEDKYFFLVATQVTQRLPFEKIPKHFSKELGYPGTKTLIRAFRKKYYPDLAPSDTAVIIRYRILRSPNGTPIKFTPVS